MSDSAAPRPSPDSLLLVTGATGYVGGRLVPELLERGYSIRCIVRDPARLRGLPWADRVDVVRGDVLDPATLPPAMDGVHAAYYLIHSLHGGEEEFAERDRRAADYFGRAAREAGVERILYLGGLRPKGERVSRHLRSRIETGERLRSSGVPVTELRAAQIVGSGSLSFELVRYLVERVPVMICPRWVRTRTQPIAVADVLAYLVRALEVPESTDHIVEIGGADVLTYREMFLRYARIRGLRRILLDVPVLTPRLSSLWVGLVTPISTRVARPLIEGLDNEVVVEDDTAARLFDVDPVGYDEAVGRALEREERGDVETIWHGAFSSSEEGSGDASSLEESEGMIRERRSRSVGASPGRVFREVCSLGGDRGWLYADVLWRLRGLLDWVVGGVGLRRGRRDPQRLRVGDALDFWRVEALEQDRLLRLRAEMKLPGRAWLQFEIEPEDDGGPTRLVQTAFFEPKGLAGLAYWYLLYPAHRVIFEGLIDALARRAREG